MTGTIADGASEPAEVRLAQRVVGPHKDESRWWFIIAAFGLAMGRTYSGIGDLTGGRLKFNSDCPAVAVVDDDSRPILSKKDRLLHMTNISNIHARQLLDSRGNPTIEAEVQLDSGAI